MPRYEWTIVTRSLNKTDLVTVIKRAATTLLNHGAVIADLQSLGHRDLPYKRNTRQLREPVFTTNTFLFNTYMPQKTMHSLSEILMNDQDLLFNYAVDERQMDETPVECNLDELLKPPAYRQSVEDLRTGQRIGHYSRMRRFKRTEREWKAIPKSYPVPPPRK